MDRELLVMRHAKSSWDVPLASDAERPLAPRGRRDAPRMAEWLAGAGLIPDRIICSPAVRARQTADAVMVRFDLPAAAIRHETCLYGAGLDVLRQVIEAAIREARRLLLVGHNPALDELVTWLCPEPLPRTGAGKLMTTAAIAHIGLPTADGPLAPGCGRLHTLMRPKTLG